MLRGNNMISFVGTSSSSLDRASERGDVAQCVVHHRPRHDAIGGVAGPHHVHGGAVDPRLHHLLAERNALVAQRI